MARFAGILARHVLRLNEPLEPAVTFGPRHGTMLRFTQEQRRLLADKVLDVANIAAGAMVFGQFLSGQRFSLFLAGLGTATWAAFVTWSLVLTRKRPL